MKQPDAAQQIIETKVLEAIKSTIRKFRQHPAFFFTESDLHAYLYHKLYENKSRDLQVAKDGQDVYLVHREYPTNFRYTKSALLEMDAGYEPDSGQGDRGHYDLAVLNPQFAVNHTIDHVTNKEVRDLIARRQEDMEAAKSEVLFALEFKYMVRNSKA